MYKAGNDQVDLRDRTLDFARSVIQFTRSLDKQPQAKPLLGQLIRSATSIGANFVGAKDSASKKDLRSKVLISKKEAAETYYWLKVFEEFAPKERLIKLQAECKEITLILQSIINTLKH